GLRGRGQRGHPGRPARHARGGRARPGRAPDPVSRYLVFGAPALGAAERREVLATLRSGWIGTGPRVARFEEAFRAYTGARHAVAVSSGTAALHLSLL